MVRSYEMMVIINPTVEDHSVEVKAVEELIAKLGGEVTKTDVWGKRRLAYEIQDFSEGYYVYVTFQAKPDFPVPAVPQRPERGEQLALVQPKDQHACLFP